MFKDFKNLVNMEISVPFLYFFTKIEIIAKLKVFKNKKLWTAEFSYLTEEEFCEIDR